MWDKPTILWYSDTCSQIGRWCEVLCECTESFCVCKLCISQTLLLFTGFGPEPNAQLSVRETYGWRIICLQSCSMAWDNWKSSEADSQSPCKAQTLEFYSQMNPDYKHIQTSVSREGTLNLSWNQNYINCHKPIVVGVSVQTNAELSSVDTHRLKVPFSVNTWNIYTCAVFPTAVQGRGLHTVH